VLAGGHRIFLLSQEDVVARARGVSWEEGCWAQPQIVTLRLKGPTLLLKATPLRYSSIDLLRRAWLELNQQEVVFRSRGRVKRLSAQDLHLFWTKLG
jgi:hypothetical protein